MTKIMTPKQILDFDFRTSERKEPIRQRDGYALTISQIRELIYFDNDSELSKKGFIGPGSAWQAMTLLRAVTGCRIREYDNMKVSGFRGNYLFWKLGKNQNNYRYEFVPDYVIQVLKRHKELYATKKDELFSISSKTYNRLVSKIRPQLSEQWQQKVTNFRKDVVGKFNYELQAKGIRATFATFYFYKFYERLGDYTAAMLMTAKKMRHSTKEMTLNYYIDNSKRIEVQKYMQYDIWELFEKDIQTKL